MLIINMVNEKKAAVGMNKIAPEVKQSENIHLRNHYVCIVRFA